MPPRAASTNDPPSGRWLRMTALRTVATSERGRQLFAAMKLRTTG